MSWMKTSAWLVMTLLAGVLVLGGISPAAARHHGPQIIYQNDFQGSVGPEWSNFATAVTPNGARRFLGQFINNTVSLTLGRIPPHNEMTVEFDLFVIGKWNGNTGGAGGPHGWTVGVQNGMSLLTTTFSNQDSPRRIPSRIPAARTRPCTAATESNSLGYPAPGDAVYHLTFNFDHKKRSRSTGFQRLRARSYRRDVGIENIVVSVENDEPRKTRSLAEKSVNFRIRGRERFAANTPDRHP